jgi:dihydroflavonol-4-reductase
VKDVAQMHVKALSVDASKGQRFIASSKTVSFIEIAKLLKGFYPNRKIVTMKAPNLIIRILALFDADIKSILPSLGDRTASSSRKAQEKLGINFIPVEESIRETADFLIKKGDKRAVK